jgi:hypothetical protein
MHQGLHKLYTEISEQIEIAFRILEARVRAPEVVPQDSDFVFRYTDQSVEAAVVQKCARMISGLNSILALLTAGFTQEVGAIFRMIDEFNEDITFLCDAIRTGEITELHAQYLEFFYLEEFDNPDNPLLSTQKRPTVPRKRIHAAIARMEGQEVNPSDSQDLHRTISQAYSGYVHAASPHCMDMYGGEPARFQVSSMLGTRRIDEFYRNAWDYFYRSYLTIILAALSFQENDLLKDLYTFRAHIEAASGHTKWEDPEKMIKRLKRKDV